MGNSVSGVSSRLQRIIKDETIFGMLLVASETTISIDMDPEHRVKDPYNSKYKLHLCNKIASDVILLFPHYDRSDMKIMYVYKYKWFTSLQRDINKRIKNVAEEGLSQGHRIFDQMVVCWGDYTYKLSGLVSGNVYLLWATQIRGVTGSSKTKLYVNPDGCGVPVIVVTNGHYKPMAIFPIHPGESIDRNHRARPIPLNASKSKIFWDEEHILFVLDKPYPKENKIQIKKKTALQVKSDVNEFANIDKAALEEEDDFLNSVDDDDGNVDEGPMGAPPLSLVRGDVLTQDLTITYFERSGGSIDKGKQKGEEINE